MKKSTLVFTLFITFGNLFAQAPDTLWTRIFGGSGDDVGYSVCQTSDGGFIIAGSTESFGAGMEDIWLIRTDTNGDTLWTKTFGGIDWDIGHSVQQTIDGGFIITGEKYSIGSMEDIWLIKTDADGNSIWTKSFGFSNSSDIGHSVKEISDNGYVIAGTIWGPGPHVFLLRTDSKGDSLWMKRYRSRHTGGVECSDSGNSVKQTSDGGFIIAGTIGDWENTHRDIWLIRTDSDGDTLWTKRYDLGGDNFGHSVQQTTDGGFIISGENPGILLIRADANGDTLWTKSYGLGLFGAGHDVLQISDGGFIILGTTRLNVIQKNGTWLIRTNANGDTLWTKTFGSSEWYNGRSVQQTSDGGYIITGSTSSFGAGESNVWLTRIAPEPGTLVDNRNCIKLNTYKLLSNYPNPFNPSTTIEFVLPKPAFVTLKVYNLLGEEVTTLIAEQRSAGIHKFNWDARGLTSGVYLYRLEAGNFVQTRKLVLMH